MTHINVTLKNYIPKIQSIFGKNLVSIIQFGSSVRNDFVKGVSDINILILLKKFDAKQIGEINKIYSILKKRINLSVPLILTENEIKQSTDVFPIEYKDMQDFHKVLLGKDVLNNLKISHKDLRLEIESQSKGKLILLREAFIQFYKSNTKLKKIIISSLPSIKVILRNITILNKKKLSNDFIETVNTVEKLSKISLPTIKKLINFKEKKIKLSLKTISDVFASYIKEVEDISNYIDRFNGRKR